MNARRFASRMKKELEMFVTSPPTGISCCPKEPDSLTLEAVIIGPEGTPYEGGIFHLDIILPDEYPFFPPRVRFLTRIYHPNIDEHGRICLDLLKVPPQGNWRCTCSIANLLLAIQCLLSDPNPGDPLNPDIADVYLNNRDLFNQIAQEHTRRYAVYPDPPVLPDDVTTSPLLKSKLTCESLDNIPAVFQLEESSTSVAAHLHLIDSEPGISLREDRAPANPTAGPSTSRGTTHASTSDAMPPQRSIMEPDNSAEGTLRNRLRFVERERPFVTVQKSLTLMEPDLMESVHADHSYFECMAGPSTQTESAPPVPSTSFDVHEPSTSSGMTSTDSKKRNMETDGDEANKRLKRSFSDLVIAPSNNNDTGNVNNNNNNVEPDDSSSSDEQEQPPSGVKRSHPEPEPAGKKDILSKRKKSC